jgi:hypothetical protein
MTLSLTWVFASTPDCQAEPRVSTRISNAEAHWSVLGA